ncbi:Hyalin [Holothuria leucospilota]|uniref:Hyalin n=1 Tax=Holothuria leucospilota TaxID=206669 RepID=A0A9Q1CBR9_HOLLE|nr:Hyalin [Holothuria leucospilota]
MPHRLEIPILCLVNLFAVVQGQLGRSCDNPSVCTVPVRSCFHRPLPSNAPLGEVNYACNCSENELIGYACNVRSPLGHIDFQTCYGNDCRTGCFTSDGYPGLYRDRWTAIYLLFIPGATRIDFEFTGEGGFDVESFKDDLFIGPGLEFNEDDLRLNGVILPGSLVRFYDNRNLSGEVYPPPFSMATDSVWIFFQTDKNIRGNGWKLSWRSTVDTTPPTVIGCPSDITEILSLGMGSSLSVTWDPEPFGNDASPPVTTIASHSPGQFFVIGTTTVTYTFQDRFENNAICSFDVNVVEVDNTPPECVNLPADISETVELGTPNSQVFYIEPTCSDISGTASVITRTHTPPATFNVGVTTVSYTCGDASGNTETCSFSVSVTAVDTTPPTLMCAQDVQETIELGRTGTAVFWTEPTATDISGTVSLQSRSHSPGSTFPVGETTVTYVFIDNAGNSATCTFRVVVLPVDSTPPMCENLPANVVEMVELGTTGTVISWTEPTCSDVSGTAVVTARSNTPFSFFEVGTTTVTYTCTDAAGNSESCSFPVTVVAVDTTSPTCVNLPTAVFETVELGQPGTVVTWTEPTCSDTSGEATVTMRSQVPSSFFPVGMTMVTYTCTDGSGNNEMCSFTVTVTEVDRTAPMCVNIPTGVSDTVELGTLGRQVTWVELTCSDLSGTAQVTSRSHTPNSFFTVGSTEVTYICTDASGNSESCIFSVTVIAVDTTAPECVNLPIDIGRTVELGTPGIEISWIEPTCSDLSGTASISTRSHTPPSFFAIGMAVVSYTCTDMSGNSNTCSFSVTVSTVDNTPPECVNLPADITETVELGTPNTQIFYIEPTCSDISGTARVIASTHTPPASFNVGVTTVSYTCGDTSGNTETCSFTVTVTPVDTTPPTVMCIADVEQTIELGSTGVAVIWTEPTATDISGSTTLQSRSHNPGSTFSVGETTVTYTFRDTAGNTANCVFLVIVSVVDTIPPMCANLPSNVVETVELGITGTVVSWTEPTCSDVSGTAVVTARSRTPFSFFMVGTTTVTYTCTDAAGNSESCSFPVTVNAVDTTPPSCLNLPSGILETVELGQSGTIVTWTEPTCSDTSGVASVTMMSHVPSTFFPVGITMVTYTCTDGSGNNEICSFSVTVIEVDRTAPMCVNIPIGVSDTVELGTPGTLVRWTELSCNDLSGTAQITSRSHTPNSFFPVGSTDVTYVCTDASGNSESCVFSVTVIAVDTTDPECVNLPNDIDRTVELGSAGTQVSWIEPTCSDVSGTASISTRSHTPPSFFTVGMSIVSYTCSDTSGNSDTCSFSVTINTIDNTPPECVNLPADITQTVELGTPNTQVFYIEPTCSDISGTASVIASTHTPPASFNVGVTTVSYTCGDASGNRETCSFTVTVTPVDRTPPTVTCVADVEQTIELGETGAVVFWSEPTATDISGSTRLQSRSHNPGSTFSVGETTITYIFRDAAGNTASCMFLVIVSVVDTIPPMCANLPSNVVETVELGTTGTVVSWTEPTCSDVSGTAVVTARSHTPFSFFMLGTTTVTYTCTDAAGNSESCNFPVTVIAVDTTPPSCLNLPSGILETVELGQSGTIVTWTEPTCSDTSGVASVTMMSHVPSTFFPVGMTLVTYTCTDGSGNNEMCSFSVTVIEVDRTAPMCVNIPIGVSDTVELGTPGTLVRWTELSCNDLSGTAQVTSRSHTPNSFFPVGSTDVTYVCTDASGNSESCVFSVTVIAVDTTDPECVNLPNDIGRTVELGSAGTQVSWIEPTCSDVSGTAAISTRSHTPPSFFTVGMSIVSYTCSDTSGNSDMCSFSVTINAIDNTPPECVNLPADITQTVELGTPNTQVFYIEPTCSDISGTASVIASTHTPPASFNVGVTTVSYTCGDASGNRETCSFTVTVTPVDTIPPMCANLPSNVVETVELGTTGTVVSWTEPTCSDVSGTAVVSARSHTPFSFFMVGTTTVTYTCTDAADNSESCSFPVTVIAVDTTPPSCLNLPSGILETVELGQSGTIVTWTEPTCSDTSGVASVTMMSHVPSTFFPVGMTMVTYTCTDGSRNNEMCSFSVTVIEVDRTAPMCVNIPIGVSDTVELGTPGTLVRWTELSCSDLSGTAEVTSRSHTPNSFFPVGSTDVTYVCTDASGNSESCVFSVTVIAVDTTDPECVNLPNDIGRTVELGLAGTQVSWIEPTCSDVSGTASISTRSHTPPSFFTVGMSIVSYTCSDTSGNSDTCSFSVTINTIDNTPPECVNLPADITQTVELGTPNTQVFYIEPTCSDISGTASVIASTHTPPASFNVGVTTVSYTCGDASGNRETCSFTVTVTPVDRTPPTVTCVADVEQTIELGETGTVVFWSEPTATDISGSTRLQSRSHNPGSTFSVGETTVTYIFRDAAGNTASCMFLVIVSIVDTIPPMCANLPSNVVETVELGITGTVVSWTEPACSDVSGTAVVTARSHTPFSFFMLGTTTVTYTCTDAAGNSESCSFPVTVIAVDTTPPSCLNLPSGILETVELGQSGTIVTWTEPTCSDTSGVASVTMMSHVPSTFFAVGMTMVTYTCTDASGNNEMCSFSVTVIEVDRTAPMCVNIPTGVFGTVELGTPGTLVTWTELTCNDISGTAEVTSRSHTPNSFFLVGSTDVTYICTDASGNSESCVFSVTVTAVDTTDPECTNLPNNIGRTVELGTPGIEISWIEPTCSDTSGTAFISSRSHTPPSFFAVGMAIVTYTCTDMSGNSNTCSFPVTVTTIDTTEPSVTCVDDVQQTVELGESGTIIFWTEPSATDISGTVSLVSRSHSPGSTFSVGETIVTYIFADRAGNSATCIFRVVIVSVDRTPPTVTCVADVEQTIELGETGAVVFWSEPTATDISGSTTLQSRSHNPGSTFSVGETTVTYIFRDAAGNTAPCIFLVIVSVADTIPPMCANLPSNVVETVELGITGIVVSWTEPTCNDISGTAVVTARTHTPLTFFAVGTTTVTYTCTDAAGNSESCSFPVTVIAVDTTPPSCLNLPSGILETVELGQSGTIVTWSEPTCSDTSGVASVTMRSHVPSTFFPVGMTIVTYTCTDGSGNNEMCSFSVTVIEVDRTAPMCVNIPTGVFGTVELGTPGTLVTWTELTCNDISGTAEVTSRSHTPNSFFPVGSTDVTYICTDASGNSESCVFSVTVTAVDTTDPECTNLPNNIGRTVELGTPGIEISWIEPTCSDTSGTAFISSRSHTPPSFFAVGMSIVTYTCTDMSGNSNTCSFPVTVTTIDTTEPSVTCVDDVQQTVELGESGTIIFWTEPSATDISGTESLVSRSHSSGSTFSVGETIVTYIFADRAGNSATCIFRVVIVSVDTRPPTVICLDNIQETTELGISGTTVFWTEPSATDTSGSVSLVSRSHAPGTRFLVGKTTVTYEFSDSTGNTATCIFCVCVNAADRTAPMCVNVPTGVSATVELGTSGTQVTWTELTCSDLSGTAEVTSRSHIPNSFFNVGSTDVTYICSDASGNTESCIFPVTVISVDSTRPMCENVPTIVVETVEVGTNGAVVNWMEPTCSDVSGTAVVTDRSHTPFSFFMVGTTIVTYTCTDAAGNSDSCSFSVVVIAEDTTAPSCVNLPNGVVERVELGQQGTDVTWTEPTCSDASGVASVSMRSHIPSSFFPVGMTTVTYTCTDGSGNSEMCSFTVVVIETDSTAPMCVNVPTGVSATVELGVSGSQVSWTEPTCVDLSGTASVTSRSHIPNSFFAVGSTDVTYLTVRHPCV